MATAKFTPVSGAWNTASNWDLDGVQAVPNPNIAYDFFCTNATGTGRSGVNTIPGGLVQKFSSWTFAALNVTGLPNPYWVVTPYTSSENTSLITYRVSGSAYIDDPNDSLNKVMPNIQRNSSAIDNAQFIADANSGSNKLGVINS
jgi:hypothetical protein